MSNETRAKIVKAAPNRWLVFCILTLSGGIAFKLSSMKDMFYVPMQQFMGLSNTQIGGALSAYGIVQTIGLIAGIYICDMFSKKYMIGGSLIGLGAVGVYLSTFPGYWGFLAAFGVMAILGEVTYWPVLLKAIRLLGDEKTQGRMFGFLEMGRGIVDVIIASTALAIFKAMGEGAGALRGGLLFLSAVTAAAGVLCLIFVPNDEKRVDETGKEVNKAQAAFGGMMQAVKSVDIWAVSLNGFTVYCIYCGLTYFIPFLNQIYFLPAPQWECMGSSTSMALRWLAAQSAASCLIKYTDHQPSTSGPASWYVSLQWRHSSWYLMRRWGRTEAGSWEQPVPLALAPLYLPCAPCSLRQWMKSGSPRKSPALP